MRPRMWDIDSISNVISSNGFRSVKEWRIDEWPSYLAAQRGGLLPYLAQKHGLSYNPNMGRKQKRTRAKTAPCP